MYILDILLIYGETFRVWFVNVGVNIRGKIMLIIRAFLFSYDFVMYIKNKGNFSQKMAPIISLIFLFVEALTWPSLY